MSPLSTLPTRARSPVNVAGAASLLVAKLHKIGERQEQPGRLLDKDAHDIYRLLSATQAAEIAIKLAELLADDLAGPATRTALNYLRELFDSPTALGPTMVGRAELLVGNPAVAGASAAVLAGDLINAIDG